MIILVSALLLATLAALLWRDLRRKRRQNRGQATWDRLGRDRARPERRRAAPRREILVDGSNVMHWQDNSPRIETLREVVQTLVAQGYRPGVIFDANAGYKLFGRYCDDDFMGRALGLPEAQVLVVPKGEPADKFLLEVSRQRQAPVVTRDRFRDWIDAYPEAAQPGRLIRGGFRDGKLWLDLKETA